jgi:competence protein ComEC
MPPGRSTWILSGLACFLAATLFLHPPALVTPAQAGELVVEVLDVGQGDAILIRSPEGKAVLIDAGVPDADVLSELRARGVERLDMVVASHAHMDHIGGLPPVLEAMPVGVFMDNGLPHTTQVYEELMQTVERLERPYMTAERGQLIQLGEEATLEVLLPAKRPLRGTRSDLNANSVILRLEYQDHCMLFTGDAEPETEQRLMARGLEPCEVLKVAHHGGRHSTSRRFLAKLQPSIAIISVSDTNRYGHPGDETLDRLERAGATTYRTDQHGDVRVIFSEEGVRVETETEDGAPAHQEETTGSAPGPE